MNNWIEISGQNLADNFRALRTAAGADTEVLAVVKANAYGHGAELCAKILVRARASWLGVTCASEGSRIRAALAGAQAANSPEEASILVMCGFLPEDVPLLREHRLTPVVWTPGQVEWLAGNRPLGVHLEVDTGMGRQGVTPGPELAALLDRIAASNLIVDGIFTHFCSSEQARSALTELQRRRFEAALVQVSDHGIFPRWLHAGNSSTLDNPAEPAVWLSWLAATYRARAMVRPGLALYGYTLPVEGDARSHVRAHLQPVLTWKTRILSVRMLATGETVGYNAIFTADRPMRIALLPVGYADGLRRELSSSRRAGGWVMIEDRSAPILGRISMNLTVVDISAHPSASPGDEAILLGPGVTADDHAALAGTIAYEILCGIHPGG